MQSIEAVFLALIFRRRRFNNAMTGGRSSSIAIASSSNLGGCRCYEIIVGRRRTWPRQIRINMFEGLVVCGRRPFPSARDGRPKKWKESWRASERSCRTIMIKKKEQNNYLGLILDPIHTYWLIFYYFLFTNFFGYFSIVKNAIFCN